MRITLGLCFLAAVLTGCFASKPTNNVGFLTPSTLHELDGRYRNLGESGKAAGSVYLSELIPAWEDHLLHHRKIVAIDVRAHDETELHVQALLEGDTVAIEQTFVRGKDFEFHNGRIRFGPGFETFSSTDIMTHGVSHSTLELGLDRKGEGKYRGNVTFVGVSLIVPVVAHGVVDVRFVKIGD